MGFYLCSQAPTKDLKKKEYKTSVTFPSKYT